MHKQLRLHGSYSLHAYFSFVGLVPASCINVCLKRLGRMVQHLDLKQVRQADSKLLVAVEDGIVDLLTERKREGLMKSLVFLTGFGHDERTP